MINELLWQLNYFNLSMDGSAIYLRKLSLDVAENLARRNLVSFPFLGCLEYNSTQNNSEI